ncbi:unnamed protein product [Schistocephalus solidus]|uniref:Uncharacterized protein n=1 Tax=Schistocephalus solidus TaxID=70667 RepID=A0A183SXN4_SCHSO|nr:unnamed protein product [Schistocephalus solidus]
MHHRALVPTPSSRPTPAWPSSPTASSSSSASTSGGLSSDSRSCLSQEPKITSNNNNSAQRGPTPWPSLTGQWSDGRKIQLKSLPRRLASVLGVAAKDTG